MTESKKIEPCADCGFEDASEPHACSRFGETPPADEGTCVTTPDHYEVVVARSDSTSVRYLVIASSAAAAEAHAQTLLPEGRILQHKTLHHTKWTCRFEVAA